VAKFAIVTPFRPYRDHVRVPVVVRFEDKVDDEAVFKIVRRNYYDVWELRINCSYYSCSYAYLSKFVSLNCRDSYFRMHEHRLLGEGAFKELMASQIAKCYKKEKIAKEKLELLEGFVNMRFGEMRYPAVVDCFALDYMCKIPRVLKAPVYESLATMYLLGDRFCLESPLDYSMLLLPYDPDKVDVRAVWKIAGYKVYLYRVIKEADSIRASLGELAGSKLEDALKTASYVAFLLEMLEG